MLLESPSNFESIASDNAETEGKERKGKEKINIKGKQIETCATQNTSQQET